MDTSNAILPTLDSPALELRGTVGDVMVKDVQTVFPDATVSEVAERIVKRNLRRVVVVDYHHRVLGVVSQRDIVRYFLLEQDGQTDPPALLAGGAAEVKSILDDRKPITVAAELPLMKAAVVLAKSKIGCLPVVGAGQKLEGLLSLTDILRNLTGHTQDSLENGFQFYSPLGAKRARIPAYIRRMNGDLVVPLTSVDNPDSLTNLVMLAYDGAVGRILIKFVDDGNAQTGAIRAKRDKENVVIPASGFVTHFELHGKASAFDVSCHEESRYLVLTPKQGSRDEC